jgi:hypothetical protein
MLRSAPVTVENQHFVFCPDLEGEPDGNGGFKTFKASVFYAVSPEAAVEEARKLYSLDDFHQAFDTSAIRIAEGAELPWNVPGARWIIETETTRVTLPGNREDLVKDYTFEGRPFTIREATPTEAEACIREDLAEGDFRDEEDFNYGFNVLYHQQREAEID